MYIPPQYLPTKYMTNGANSRQIAADPTSIQFYTQITNPLILLPLFYVSHIL